MRLLVLGGTRFVGRAVVEEALAWVPETGEAAGVFAGAAGRARACPAPMSS